MCPAGKAVPYFAPGHCPDLTHGTDDPCYDKDRSMMWHNLIRRSDASKFSQRLMYQRPDIYQSWGMMNGTTTNGWYVWLGYGLEDAGFKGTPGARDFPLLRLSRLWGPPSHLLNGYLGSFLMINWPGCDADHPPHPALRLGISGAIPLLPLYSFMPWTGKL